MRLHLLRHGRTRANEQRLYCGRTDLSLTEEGAAELHGLRDAGIYPPADVFVTSGLLRARMTLQILYGDVPHRTAPGLAEYDFGVFEMRSYEELREDPAYLAWILDETGGVPCPGGESRASNRRRVLTAFDALRADLYDSGIAAAAVVCHGGTIAVIMDREFPGEHDFYEWQPAPGRGVTLLTDTNGAKIYHNIRE